ncbi:MAG: hexokinase [Eubacteriaceae bacterium]|nr:hexokinase [Eubacteriaceae bacterium]
MSIDYIKSEVDKFLADNGMSPFDIDFKKETRLFTEEMIKGLEGRDSSLKMIPAFIDPSSILENDKPVIAIDAGGTNFRRALITHKNNSLQVDEFQGFPMPGMRDKISSDEFFDTMIGYLKPILDKSERIGFCFSYPVEILPSKDGIILGLTKEIKVDGIIGIELGQEINRRLEVSGIKGDKKVVVLNDTTACLLSGKAMSKGKKFDSYIGLILGTGTNTCYIERNENVKKSGCLKENPGETLINLESGGYAGIKNGKIDQLADRKTINPGEHIFEKMISGAYLGAMVLETLKRASEEEFISSGFSREIQALDKLSSATVSEFYENSRCYGDILRDLIDGYGTDNDRKAVYFIIDNLLERSAKILAINVNGILNKIDKGKNPEKPVCIVIEGSTFYGSKKYQDKFDKYMELIKEQYGYHTERIKVDNASLLGSAIAGLLD